jgi:hypothetical protein
VSVMKLLVSVLSVLALAGTSSASVLCSNKMDQVFVRDSCKKKEKQVDLTSVGLLGPQGPQGPMGQQGPQGYNGIGVVGPTGPAGTGDPTFSAVIIQDGLGNFTVSGTPGVTATSFIASRYNVLRVRFPGVDVSKCVYITSAEQLADWALTQSAVASHPDVTNPAWPAGNADSVDVSLQNGGGGFSLLVTCPPQEDK